MTKEFKISNYKTDLQYYISATYTGKELVITQELEEDLVAFEKYLQDKYIDRVKATTPFFRRLIQSL